MRILWVFLKGYFFIVIINVIMIINVIVILSSKWDNSMMVVEKHV